MEESVPAGRQTFVLKEIKEFFGYESLDAFSRDWKSLSEWDRYQIRQGLADRTFTY